MLILLVSHQEAFGDFLNFYWKLTMFIGYD